MDPDPAAEKTKALRVQKLLYVLIAVFVFLPLALFILRSR
jgi:hypothetical protein